MFTIQLYLNPTSIDSEFCLPGWRLSSEASIDGAGVPTGIADAGRLERVFSMHRRRPEDDCSGRAKDDSLQGAHGGCELRLGRLSLVTAELLWPIWARMRMVQATRRPIRAGALRACAVFGVLALLQTVDSAGYR